MVIRDLKLDGRDDLNTAGTQYGIYYNGIGSSTLQGGKILNVRVEDFRSSGIRIGSSSANAIITESEILNNVQDGVLNAGASTSITNNTILSNGNGIYNSTGPTNTIIDSNTIGNNSNYSITNFFGSNTIVSNNKFNNNEAGIDVGDGSQIVGNLITNNGGSDENDGILVFNDNISIIGNTIIDTSCTTDCLQ